MFCLYLISDIHREWSLSFLKVITAVITCSKMAFSLPLRYFSINKKISLLFYDQILLAVFLIWNHFCIPYWGLWKEACLRCPWLQNWLVGVRSWKITLCSCAFELIRWPPALWEIAHSSLYHVDATVRAFSGRAGARYLQPGSSSLCLGLFHLWNGHNDAVP